jgi:hypothetical protein
MTILKDALTVGITSREAVFDGNLAVRPCNRPIRRALGLRETGKLEARLPTFTSPDVQQLYKKINHIAVHRLPVESLDALHRAWHAGTYEKDMKKLSNEFSYIWEDAMEERRPVSNPDSRLLIKGEDEYYSTDLFWELGSHRAL